LDLVAGGTANFATVCTRGFSAGVVCAAVLTDGALNGPVRAVAFTGLTDKLAAGRAAGNLAAAKAAPDLTCGGDLEVGSELAGGSEELAGGSDLGEDGCCVADGGAGAVFGAGLAFTLPGNCSSSLPWMAARIKVIQMGSAAFAPVSFSPSDWRLS
jgi:hypothetical protein